MPNAAKLKKLVELRRARGKSQKDAALYFGLAGSARNEISKWENGEKVPPPRYREQFIDYLCDFLNLSVDRERFNALWTMLSEEWGWDAPSAQELERCFPPISVAHISDVTYESTRGREYGLFGIPLWSIHEYEGRREYRVFGLVVWSTTTPSRYLLALGVVAILCIVAIVAGILRGRDDSAQRARGAPTPTIWDHRERVGIQCKSQDYPTTQGTVKTRVCAWINIDYTNHRMRGYSTVEHLDGPNTTSSTTIRLRQDNRIVYERSIPWTDKTYIQPATDLWNCREGEQIVLEIEAMVSYPDGQQRTYTVISDPIDSRC